MRTKQNPPSHSSKRAWTDLVFDLYVEGSLAPLSAMDVRQSIDRIASDPSQLARMERSSPEELRSGLIVSVNRWASPRNRTASRAGSPRKTPDATERGNDG